LTHEDFFEFVDKSEKVSAHFI